MPACGCRGVRCTRCRSRRPGLLISTHSRSPTARRSRQDGGQQGGSSFLDLDDEIESVIRRQIEGVDQVADSDVVGDLNNLLVVEADVISREDVPDRCDLLHVGSFG
nr:MAG TPA: hypothetical protein [Caudoviricetes sp.]